MAFSKKPPATILFPQESVCTPAGSECYKPIKSLESKCLSPCQGVFAGVDKNKNFKQVEDMMAFNQIFESYKLYKTGYSKDQEYTKEIAGQFK